MQSFEYALNHGLLSFLDAIAECPLLLHWVYWALAQMVEVRQKEEQISLLKEDSVDEAHSAATLVRRVAVHSVMAHVAVMCSWQMSLMLFAQRWT